ncbi:venom acid phosphatase Acph-1-like [Microplitis demolitor]|uniref:venom acid phosphatase Acph-1-like n=1 Tax=Microplitis demolitor TaxID=69319 RepID=UPI00235B6EB3|nr:venom acid phosphatase Acph-1-like [Microplitis demolitor]
MSLWWIKVFKIIIIQGLIGIVRSDAEIKLLHVLFRHGDKVPHKEFQNYPTDPHGNHSYYPMDSGDLTNEGKLREYKIGQVLREKYGEFFGPYYQPSLIFGRSTDIPRTQMSLELVLAGLFPPTGKQIWNPHLPWIPVSTVSVPNEQDSLLFPHHCPEYIKEYKNFLGQGIAKNMINKHKEVMKYLTDNTGKQVDQTSAVYYLYNLFNEQIAQNLTLPEWTKNVYPNSMKEITELDFNLRSYTNKLKRLNGGILLHEITEGMKALRDGVLQPHERKAFFYSAHELNVAAAARALGTNDPILPLYGSTIIFETLKDEHNNYFIKVQLWTGVTEQFITQTIPGCTELCPLDQFLKLLRDVIATDKEADCYGLKKNEKNSKASSSSRFNFNTTNVFICLVFFSLKFFNILI